MAGVITRIRRHAWLAVLLIGVSMAIFVLMDLFRTGGLGRGKNYVLKVAGKKIDVITYDAVLKTLEERFEVLTGTRLSQQQTEQLHADALNQTFIQEVLAPKWEEIGIACTEQELQLYLRGPLFHPLIRQFFTNPQTRQFDPSQVEQFALAAQQDPTSQAARVWEHLKSAVYWSVLQDKYLLTIAKGIYIPEWLAQEIELENTASATISYRYIPYSTIPSEGTVPSDEEVKAYIEEHRKEFELKDPVRVVRYVSWAIVPSPADSQKAYKRAKEIEGEWLATDQPDSVFVDLVSDEPFSPAYKRIDDFPFVVIPELTQTQPDSKQIIGPILADNAYRLYKVLEVRQVPDSVSLWHVFIRAISQEELNQAHKLLDSLKDAIQTGQLSLDSAASKYSHDEFSARNNGYVGWLDLEALHPSLKYGVLSHLNGELFIAETPMGIHLAKVVDTSGTFTGYKVAEVVVWLEASDRTRDSLYQEALTFAQHYTSSPDSFQKGATLLDRPIRRVRLRPEVFYVAELGNARPLVRWAFSQSEEGVFSEVIELDDFFVVAYLHAIYDAGEVPLEDVYPLARARISNLKKAESLIGKLSGIGSLNDVDNIAPQGTQKGTAQLYMGRDFVPGMGVEKKVVGTAFGIMKGSISAPIVGEGGIAIIHLDNITIPETHQSDLYRNILLTGWQSAIASDWLTALKRYYRVEDYRWRFY